MSDPHLPRINTDSNSLRPMLMKWAVNYSCSPDEQQILVERTILFAPDRLYEEPGNGSVEDVLASLMRDIAAGDNGSGNREHAA